jgi:hypothetical protein
MCRIRAALRIRVAAPVHGLLAANLDDVPSTVNVSVDALAVGASLDAAAGVPHTFGLGCVRV